MNLGVPVSGKQKHSDERTPTSLRLGGSRIESQTEFGNGQIRRYYIMSRIKVTDKQEVGNVQVMRYRIDRQNLGQELRSVTQVGSRHNRIGDTRDTS